MFGKGGPSFFELMKQALSSTEEGYDLLAPKFDKTPFRTPDELVEKAVEHIDPKVDAALDLCCGTGVGLVKLRPRVASRLVGVDFSKGMLDEARHELQLDGLVTNADPRVELVESDVFHLRYDGEFDVVTCFGAFGHILEADEVRFLEIVRRALRPGGEFVFVTAPKPPFYAPKAVVAHAFNAAMRVRNAVIKPPFIMYYLTFLLPEIERRLRWSGFSVATKPAELPSPFHHAVVVRAKRV
ncbi:MAG: class I SAM-dependent methyltransferase [Polyangiaceae bacterium]